MTEICNKDLLKLKKILHISKKNKKLALLEFTYFFNLKIILIKKTNLNLIKFKTKFKYLG